MPDRARLKSPFSLDSGKTFLKTVGVIGDVLLPSFKVIQSIGFAAVSGLDNWPELSVSRSEVVHLRLAAFQGKQ